MKRMTYLELARLILDGEPELQNQDVVISAMTLSKSVINADVFLEQHGSRWMLVGYDPPIRRSRNNGVRA